MPEQDRLVLGTAALGLAYGLGRDGQPPVVMTDGEAGALVARAVAAGISTFDTAPAYGLAEERLGRSLGERGAVWTKVGGAGPGLEAEVTTSIDTSLARLARPRLELVQWHNWSPAVGALPAFRRCWRRLATDGRIRALGASTYGPDDALAAVESGLFQVVQVEWNLLNQRVVERILDPARRASVHIAVRSVFLQGALSGDARDLPPLPALHAAVRRADALAQRLGLPLPHLALRAALDLEVSYVLVGLDRAAQLDHAAAVARAPRLACVDEVRALDVGGAATDPRTWR